MKSCLAAVFLLLIASIATTETQSNPPDAGDDDTAQTSRSAPVVVDGVELFRVTGISAYPPEKRAQAIGDRIKQLAANRAYSTQALTTNETLLGTQILIDNLRIMTLLDDDARLEGVQRRVLAQAYLLRIGGAITDFRRDREASRLTRLGAYAIAAVLAVLFGLFSANRIFRKLRLGLERRYREKIHGVQIQMFHLIHAEQLWRALIGALSLLWLVFAVAVSYLGMHYILSLFPWTRGF